MLKAKENHHQSSMLHNAQIFEHVNERHPVFYKNNSYSYATQKGPTGENGEEEKLF